jgi:hypothetical protein
VTYRSDDEIKAECIARMDRRLGAISHRLYKECVWLHMKWREYVALYGVNTGRIDILNAAAPFSVRIVEDVVWNDVLLHIARLTDPPRTAQRRETLSIGQLPNFVDATLQDAVRAGVEKAESRAKFARDWRHRKLAHADLQLALGNAKPLEPASRAIVADALQGDRGSAQRRRGALP